MEVLLIFHQALQVEKESGARGEEDIGDSQEPLGRFHKLNDNSQLHTSSYSLSNLCTISFLLQLS